MEKVVPLPVNGRSVDNASISLDDRDDDALMLMARAGVERAFELLVKRHQGLALGTAVKYLGDPLLAEDIAQNSFLDLYRHVAVYRAEGKFRSFLAKIVINNCRMANRRHRSEVNTRQGFRFSQPEARQDAVEILQREQQQVLDAAVQRLAPKLKEVVVLRYSADMSYKEIADTLGIRLGTVKSRLFAGIEKLSRALEAMER